MAVPSPLSEKVTPLGSEPTSDRAAVGKPVEVTVKVPAEPSEKVVLSPEVMARGLVDGESEGLRRVRADSVGGRDGDRVGPAGPAAGVPARVAVPSPLSEKVTPLGSDADLRQSRRREARRGHREGAGRAVREGRAVARGDGRGLVDGESEGLRRVRG